MAEHPVHELVLAAARGEFPDPDGKVRVVEAPPGRADAVLAFTAHHVIACDLDPDEVLAQLPEDDLGAPMAAPFLAWLGRRLRSSPGMVDLVLAAEPLAGDGARHLVDAPAGVREHPRVQRAALYRDDVRAYTDPAQHGVMAIGRGLAGRLEVTIEVEPAYRGHGVGRQLALAARGLAGDEPLFAQVSPGNSGSVRAFVAAGYRPIGGEVLFLRSDG